MGVVYTILDELQAAYRRGEIGAVAAEEVLTKARRIAERQTSRVPGSCADLMQQPATITEEVIHVD